MISDKNRKLIRLGCPGIAVLNNSTGINTDISDANSNSSNDDMTKNLVVTIPGDMQLPVTEAETSVLSKGLTFVPLNVRSEEFQAKSDCMQFSAM